MDSRFFQNLSSTGSASEGIDPNWEIIAGLFGMLLLFCPMLCSCFHDIMNFEELSDDELEEDEEQNFDDKAFEEEALDQPEIFRTLSMNFP